MKTATELAKGDIVKTISGIRVIRSNTEAHNGTRRITTTDGDLLFAPADFPYEYPLEDKITMQHHFESWTLQNGNRVLPRESPEYHTEYERWVELAFSDLKP